MIRSQLFNLGKKQTSDRMEEFFRTTSLDPTQVLLAQAVQMSAGHTSFLLVYNDVSPPYVTGSSPADGANSVPTGVDIVLQMSEAVSDPSGCLTITRNGVTLTEGVDYTLSPAPWPGAGSTTITIVGAVDSTYNATYVVTVQTTVTDTSGNAMESPHVFSFTTSSQGAAVVWRGGTTTPNAGDVAAGFIDVTFAGGYNFPNTSYQVFTSMTGALAEIGVILRISNKATSGFRINFDCEDYSAVETAIDTVVAAYKTNLDANYTAQINAQHANAGHAAPQNALAGLNVTLPAGAAAADCNFSTGNSIDWLAAHGLPS